MEYCYAFFDGVKAKCNCCKRRKVQIIYKPDAFRRMMTQKEKEIRQREEQQWIREREAAEKVKENLAMAASNLEKMLDSLRLQEERSSDGDPNPNPNPNLNWRRRLKQRWRQLRRPKLKAKSNGRKRGCMGA